ncbi:hypothetical protein AVEN_52340-1 [Araneus ventricosus]|uniref:Uncharacterized protein n=1 Tax=Araneus ventricosus TaxID=182803 RepID=A0A4Y2SA78_ARAVE|nr:hypothetical protein AVEN_52340-1 [Araneus ventricosus]
MSSLRAGFPTYRTFIKFSPTMRSAVRGQITLNDEAFPTLITLKGLLPSMSSIVVSDNLSTDPFSHITRQGGLLPSMSSIVTNKMMMFLTKPLIHLEQTKRPSS